MDIQLPGTLSQFLTFMATPVFGAWVISEFIEPQAWFQKLPSGRKSVIVLCLMLILAVVGFALVHWTPPSAVEQLQPLYSIIIGTVVAFLSSQYYHGKAHADNAAG